MDSGPLLCNASASWDGVSGHWAGVRSGMLWKPEELAQNPKQFIGDPAFDYCGVCWVLE